MLFWYLLIFIFLLIIELCYIYFARQFKILDKPNSRSSHEKVTIRGGGIVFPISALICLPYTNTYSITFGVALLIIATLSFFDDINPIYSSIRLFVQSISVVALLVALDISLHWLWFPVLFIMITGIINAYNFMDGINGITVFYSSVTIGSLYWISSYIEYLQSDLFFMSMISGLLVFAFFNVRKKAVCFAGDVGSVSMAFVICFLLLTLILKTGSVYWLFFLAVYGIDSVFTIVCRIFRKESLMEAHRSHFYQYLANERGWNHVAVSALYAIIQGLLNLMIVHAYLEEQPLLLCLFLFVIVILYITFRILWEGSKRLFICY